jgi:hypothetical protein
MALAVPSVAARASLSFFIPEISMTDFKTETRKRCRNPKCRMKLSTPVENEREAFCCRGCYQSFYLHRCIVCEGEIERTTANRKICKKSKCRNALAAGLGPGRFHGNPATTYQHPKNIELTQETPISCGSASASKRVEWRIIAGPPLTPSQFHCATVPDGPDCQWTDGAYERIEAKNRRTLEAHFDKLDAEAVANDFCASCGRTDNLGVTLCYDCRDERSIVKPAPILGQQHRIRDDLSIPPFLDRRPQELLAAA